MRRLRVRFPVGTLEACYACAFIYNIYIYICNISNTRKSVSSGYPNTIEAYPITPLKLIEEYNIGYGLCMGLYFLVSYTRFLDVRNDNNLKCHHEHPISKRSSNWNPKPQKGFWNCSKARSRIFNLLLRSILLNYIYSYSYLIHACAVN